MMHLYLLKILPIRPSYDIMNSCVVSAPTWEDARRMASTYHGDEGSDVWLSANRSTCIEIGFAHEEKTGLICRDFIGS